jgi:hypothetical protein
MEEFGGTDLCGLGHSVRCEHAGRQVPEERPLTALLAGGPASGTLGAHVGVGGLCVSLVVHRYTIARVSDRTVIRGGGGLDRAGTVQGLTMPIYRYTLNRV